MESVAKGAAAYKEPSKRNIGLLGEFIRGASFKATKINSMEEFNTIFGGQSASFFGPGVVKSIFLEAGNAPVTLYITRVTGAGSAVATATVNLSDSKTMTVKAGYHGVDDPGAWANGLKVTLYSFSSKVRGMFTLVVEYNGVVEQYNDDSLAKIQTAVNQVSKYVTIEFSGEITKLNYSALTGTITASTSSKEIVGVGTTFLSETPVGTVLVDADNNVIGTVAAVASDTALTLQSVAMVAVTGASAKKRDDAAYVATLAGGVTGDVSESDFYPVYGANPKGLAAFDGVDVQIIACTEYHSLTMATALRNYVEEQKNPFGVVNLPLNADEGTAELYANAFQTNEKSFMAGAYMGWAYIPDDNGNPMLIPAIGPILGAAYIRTPYVQGDYVHIPPAGTDSVFTNVLDMVPNRLSQATINKLVQQLTCNVVRYVDGVGFYVGSSRTYSTNPLYHSIHIRLQTSYYLRALEAKMRYMEQKPNTPELKREALVDLRTFFKNEYDNGALERSVPFETAYQGICDQSNNPPGQDRKLINITCLWIPTECTESIVISLERNDGILTTMEG